MANVLAPFGLSLMGHQDGAVPTFGLTKLRLPYNYGTQIFRGDWTTQANTGYIQEGAASAGAIGAGVFWGCSYYSVSGKIPKWSPYWPTGDAPSGQDVIAYVITDPGAKFLVQTSGASGSALPFSAVGQNADINTGVAGNTANGISGMTLDDNVVGTSNAYPFHIIDLWSNYGIPGTNGTDNTTVYNYAIVTINAAVLKAGQTGV